MNFLFWNIKNKDTFFDLICELVKENSIGILMLAEFPEGKQENMEKLLRHQNSSYKYIKPIKEKVKVEVFTSLPKKNLYFVEDGRRFSVLKYHNNGLNKDFNLILCHLISKVNNTVATQTFEARNIVNSINNIENRLNNDLTIVCGDLNMNPFEDGIAGCDSFNAVMSKSIAQDVTRRVSGNDFKMFYNPMWCFFGDNGRGIAHGTIYYNPYEAVQYYWNIFDQVLIRPCVIPYFVDRYLDIITCSNTKSLLTSSHTMRSIYSDHLPIKFTIKEK